jgi:hypothetical protein
MAALLFRCLTTGLNVQWETEEILPDEEVGTSYLGIECPACTRLHFINLSTGKLLGDT